MRILDRQQAHGPLRSPARPRLLVASFFAALATVFVSVVSPLAAEAQLGPARSALAEADFERAERAYTRALEARVLSRDDVVAIHEGRAIARWAMGQERDARGDLEALGSLEPEHALPPEAPPPLVDAFASLARAPLGAALLWDQDDGEGPRDTLHLRVGVRNDPAGLVRAVRVHLRTPGDDGWLVREERDVDVLLAPGEALEVRVERVGPGGAVLAQEGSIDAPIVRGAGARGSLGEPEGGPSSAGAGGGDATLLWVGVGVGAAVLLGLAIGIGVAVGSGQSELTQPGAPVLVGF